MVNLENCIHCGRRIVRSDIEDDEWLSYHLEGSYHDCRQIYKRSNSKAPPELQKELENIRRGLEEAEELLKKVNWVKYDQKGESSS